MSILVKHSNALRSSPGRHQRELVVIEANHAARRAEPPCQQFEQSRFACSIGADDRNFLAALDGEARRVEQDFLHPLCGYSALLAVSSGGAGGAKARTGHR